MGMGMGMGMCVCVCMCMWLSGVGCLSGWESGEEGVWIDILGMLWDGRVVLGESWWYISLFRNGLGFL